MSHKLIVVTPTGERKDAFALARHWMQRQQTKPDIWVIVDDSIFQPYLGLEPFPIRRDVIHPKVNRALKNTQRRNLLLAIEYIKHEIPNYEDATISIWEDDDFYHNNYLAWVAWARSEGYELIGEARSNYYHIQGCMYRTIPNAHSAGLFQTSFAGKWIDLLKEACLHGHPNYFDGDLWRRLAVRDIPKEKILLAPKSHLTLGIKGMPGRRGIGLGHNRQAGNWKRDKKLSWFKQYLRRDNWKMYEPYLGKTWNSDTVTQLAATPSLET